MLEYLCVKRCSIEYYLMILLIRQCLFIPCLIKIIVSKNVSHADNQQERLIEIGWIKGFVDGEGCFSIHFVKQFNKIEKDRIRKGYKTGYQIGHEFAVVQGAKSLDSLKILKDFFKVGGIHINRRHDNHKEDLYRYSVAKRQDLLDVIIPFFQKYKLKTSKRNDFTLFRKCLYLMKDNKHLSQKGAIKIALMCEQMNHKKSRLALISILRNQTSDSALNGEDRVLST